MVRRFRYACEIIRIATTLIPPSILDAIHGQAAPTVADTYGEVTLKRW